MKYNSKNTYWRGSKILKKLKEGGGAFVYYRTYHTIELNSGEMVVLPEGIAIRDYLWAALIRATWLRKCEKRQEISLDEAEHIKWFPRPNTYAFYYGSFLKASKKAFQHCRLHSYFDMSLTGVMEIVTPRKKVVEDVPQEYIDKLRRESQKQWRRRTDPLGEERRRRKKEMAKGHGGGRPRIDLEKVRRAIDVFLLNNNGRALSPADMGTAKFPFSWNAYCRVAGNANRARREFIKRRRQALGLSDNGDSGDSGAVKSDFALAPEPIKLDGPVAEDAPGDEGVVFVATEQTNDGPDEAVEVADEPNEEAVQAAAEETEEMAESEAEAIPEEPEEAAMPDVEAATDEGDGSDGDAGDVCVEEEEVERPGDGDAASAESIADEPAAEPDTADPEEPEELDGADDEAGVESEGPEELDGADDEAGVESEGPDTTGPEPDVTGDEGDGVTEDPLGIQIVEVTTAESSAAEAGEEATAVAASSDDVDQKNGGDVEESDGGEEHTPMSDLVYVEESRSGKNGLKITIHIEDGGIQQLRGAELKFSIVFPK